jgi:hypothetical protein
MKLDKLYKLVGSICCIGVMVFMVNSLLGIIVFIFIAIPLALYYKRKYEKYEEVFRSELISEDALCYVAGKCFYTFSKIPENEECLIVFSNNNIQIILSNHQTIKLSKSNIQDIQQWTLKEITDMSESNRKRYLGQLADSFTRVKKSRRFKNIEYIIIRFKNEKQKPYVFYITGSFNQLKNIKSLDINAINQINEYYSFIET